MDYLIRNHLALLLVVIVGVLHLSGGAQSPDIVAPVGVPSESTTFTNPLIFDQTTTHTGNATFAGTLAVTGTTTIGSVRQVWATVSYGSATTTPAAIRSPLTATSTLIFGACNFDVSSTTAMTITLAKAATAFATTTVLASEALATGLQATIVASTTPSVSIDGTRVFGPGEWFVMGMAGGTGNFSPTGACDVGWIVNS